MRNFQTFQEGDGDRARREEGRMPVPELQAKCSLRVFPAGPQEPREQGLGLTAVRGRAGAKQSEAPQEVGPALVCWGTRS